MLQRIKPKIYFEFPDFVNYWPLCLAEFLHACEPFSEVTVWSEAVVIWGQLEQFDLSNDLKLLQAHSRADKVKKYVISTTWILT